MVPIKLIEEFVKLMNGSVSNIGGDYMDSIPLGSYNFTIFNEEDIKNIFRYYDLTEEAPRFIPFEGRENFNVSILAKEITDNDFGPRKQNEFLNEKWENEDLGWKIYFNNNKYIFTNEVNRAIYNELNPTPTTPTVEVDPIDYKKLSLSQLYKIDKDAWKKIRDEVYERAKDEEEYYVSASGKYRSKSRVNFQIDHIMPMSEGGLTEISNLQLLTRWENYLKGIEYANKVLGIDDKNLDALCNKAIGRFYNGKYDLAKETLNTILEIDKEDIWAMSFMGDCYLEQEKYTLAKHYYSNVLKLDKLELLFC